MMSSHVDVSTRSHDCGEPESSKSKVSPDFPELLHIERLVFEPIARFSKGSVKHLTINPNAKAAQNYSIFKYLAQIPCDMSMLEVLPSCPTQRSALLTTIEAIDMRNSLVFTFDMSNIKKILPHHMAF